MSNRGATRAGETPFAPRPTVAAAGCFTSTASSSATGPSSRPGKLGNLTSGSTAVSSADAGFDRASTARRLVFGLDGKGRLTDGSVLSAATAESSPARFTRGIGLAANARSMRCSSRTAKPIPTSRSPPTAATVPGVTASMSNVPPWKDRLETTRTAPAIVVTIPRSNKINGITPCPAPTQAFGATKERHILRALTAGRKTIKRPPVRQAHVRARGIAVVSLSADSGRQPPAPSLIPCTV